MYRQHRRYFPVQILENARRPLLALLAIAIILGTSCAGAVQGIAGKAPAIATPPQSQTVALGYAVSFSVTATGAGTLSYQWLKNGNAISGATGNYYRTSATTAADNGASFTVIVSDSAGSVTSNAA